MTQILTKTWAKMSKHVHKTTTSHEFASPMYEQHACVRRLFGFCFAHVDACVKLKKWRQKEIEKSFRIEKSIDMEGGIDIVVSFFSWFDLIGTDENLITKVARKRKNIKGGNDCVRCCSVTNGLPCESWTFISCGWNAKFPTKNYSLKLFLLFNRR